MDRCNSNKMINQNTIKAKLKLLSKNLTGQVIMDIIMLADSELTEDDTLTTEDYCRAVQRLILKQKGLYKMQLKRADVHIQTRDIEDLILEMQQEKLTNEQGR